MRAGENLLGWGWTYLCVWGLCCSLQMWTSPSWPVMTLEHLSDIKHLHLFLILMFRSNPCKWYRCNSLYLSRHTGHGVVGARRCHGSTLMFWPFSFLLIVWCRIRTIFCSRYWIICWEAACSLSGWPYTWCISFWTWKLGFHKKTRQGMLCFFCWTFMALHLQNEKTLCGIGLPSEIQIPRGPWSQWNRTCAPESLLGFQEVSLSTYCPGSTWPLQTC